MAVVRASKLTKLYGNGDAGVRALDGIDLSIEQGEFVAIMGPSGSGKSTLLSIIGGLETPTIGEVEIEGRTLGKLPEVELARIRREKIGFVFQSFNLVQILTAEENVALPLLLAGQKGAPVRARVEEILALVGLSDRRTHTPAELSGGQQQRVAIARALVASPAIILADEPTGNLDSRTSAEIMALFHRFWQEIGQTIILITHDPGVAAWANRVLFLQDGRLVRDIKQEGPVPARVHRIRVTLEEISDVQISC